MSTNLVVEEFTKFVDSLETKVDNKPISVVFRFNLQDYVWDGEKFIKSEYADEYCSWCGCNLKTIDTHFH